MALFVGVVMTFVNQYIALLGWLGEKMTDNEKRFIKSIFSGDSSGQTIIIQYEYINWLLKSQNRKMQMLK